MRCDVREEAVYRLLKREGAIVPFVAKRRFGEAFATEFSGAEADKNSNLAVSSNDDGRFVAGIRDNHGAIVPVQPVRAPSAAA